jgi:hypothetical protein
MSSRSRFAIGTNSLATGHFHRKEPTMKKPIRKPNRARMHERPILPVKVLTDDEVKELLKPKPEDADKGDR